MTVSGTDRLTRDLESLLASPQGELINSLSELVRTRIRRWAVLFFVGMAVGYPIAGRALTWIVGQEQLVPDDVSIVILQPLEIVILQLRLAAHLAIALVAIAISVEATLAVSRNEELRARMGEVDIPAIPGLAKAVLTVVAGLALAAAGLVYVIHFLLPLLLEYLHADAASIGATTTWQLSAWIGFIAGLSLGAVVGFKSHSSPSLPSGEVLSSERISPPTVATSISLDLSSVPLSLRRIHSRCSSLPDRC